MRKYLLIVFFLSSQPYSMKKIIDKFKDADIYIGIGGGFSFGKRNKNFLTKGHTYLKKSNFIKNISKVEYGVNEINNNGAITSKISTISEKEANTLWNYFSHIFDRVEVDIKGGFFIKYLFNIDFLDKINMGSNNEEYKGNFISSLVNLNFISHIFHMKADMEFYNANSKIFYFYGLTNFNNMKNGLTNKTDLAANNIENKEWYVVKKNEIKKENSDQFMKASKIITNDNIFFFRQLIPTIDGDKFHYFVVDENGKIFHWKDHKDFEYEKSNFQQVNSFDASDTKKKGESINGKDLPLCKNLFKKNMAYSNDLTIMYLLSNPENNKDFPKKIIEKQDLENFILKIKEDRNLKDLDSRSLNKVFYFLLGHHGKNISCNKGFLPISYIKYSGITQEDLLKKAKEDSNLLNGENFYDISNYEGINNNEEHIKNAFNSLPIANEMTYYNFSFNILACILYKDYLLIGMYDYLFKEKITSEINEKFPHHRGNLQVGKKIFNNLYVGGIFEVYPTLYKNYSNMLDILNFLDLNVGLAIFIKISKFLLINVYGMYDVSNNIFSIRFSLNYLFFQVNGKDNCENKGKAYLEYI